MINYRCQGTDARGQVRDIHRYIRLDNKYCQNKHRRTNRRVKHIISFSFQLESNGNGIPYSDWFTIVHARLPLGHRLNYTNSLLVE